MHFNCLISREELKENNEVYVIPLITANFDFNQKLTYLNNTTTVKSEIINYNDLFEMNNGFMKGVLDDKLQLKEITPNFSSRFFEYKYKVNIIDVFNSPVLDIYSDVIYTDIFLPEYLDEENKQQLTYNKLKVSLLDLGFIEIPDKNLFKRFTKDFEYTADKYQESNFYGLEYIQYSEINGLVTGLNFFIEANQQDNININNFSNPLNRTKIQDVLVDQICHINAKDNKHFLNAIAEETGILLGVKNEYQKIAMELSNLKFAIISKNCFDGILKNYKEICDLDFDKESIENVVDILFDILENKNNYTKEELKNVYLKSELELNSLKGNILELYRFIENNPKYNKEKLKKSLITITTIQTFLNVSKIILLPKLKTL